MLNSIEHEKVLLPGDQIRVTFIFSSRMLFIEDNAIGVQSACYNGSMGHKS